MNATEAFDKELAEMTKDVLRLRILSGQVKNVEASGNTILFHFEDDSMVQLQVTEFHVF